MLAVILTSLAVTVAILSGAGAVIAFAAYVAFKRSPESHGVRR
jgi:hypothetical protein